MIYLIESIQKNQAFTDLVIYMIYCIYLIESIQKNQAFTDLVIYMIYLKLY